MTTDLETNLQIIEEFTQRLQVAVIGAEETTEKHVDWVEGPVDGTIDTANGPLKTLRGQIAEWRIAADQDVASTINGYDTQFATALAQYSAEFDAYLITVGFEPAIEYAAGLLIERRSQTVVYNGVIYYWTATLPYTTIGDFGVETSWQIAPIVGGVEIPSFNFATGGKLLRKTQSVLGLDGEWYYWTGTFPKVVPSASTLESAGGVGQNLFKIASGFSPMRSTFAINVTAMGYTLNAGSFESGATITAGTSVLVQFLSGKMYRWEGILPKVVDLNSTPASSGGVAPGAWVELIKSNLGEPDGYEHVGVGSKTPGAPMLNLKQWLDDEVVNLRTRFGVSSSATARANTDNLQEAYDILGAVGGGRLRLPASHDPYFFAPSILSESFDNYGDIILAEWACIVARPGVLLEGDGVGKSIFRVQEGDVSTIGFLAASPDGGGFRHLSVRGNSATGGNSHGIINVNISTDPIHLICQNWLLEHLELSDLGSYGIGINNGDITNLQANYIYIHNVGADGIDTKQRGPRKKNIGMHFSNIIVDGFGMRLTGCAGLDFHGVGQVTNLTARNPGLTGQTGFRMRTLDPANEGENARMSHATNILVEATPADNSHLGITIGSPDCVLQGAVARGMTDGFQLQGNASGAADRSIISNAHAIDCAQYGFFIGTGISDATLDTAYAIGCNTGFRNQGTRTTYIRAIPVNCTTKFSTASPSAPTERMIGSDTFGMTELTSGTNIITVEPRGEATDIEVRIKPKGLSRLALMDGAGNRKVQLDQNGVSFNGTAPTGKMTLNAAATDATTTTALVNQIRAGLITDGLAQ